MLWGKTINPRDYLTPSAPFTVGQPKPETVPAEVATAVEQFVQAARSEGYAMASGSSDRLHFAQSYTDRRRAALDAVILKHLRGEA